MAELDFFFNPCSMSARVNRGFSSRSTQRRNARRLGAQMMPTMSLPVYVALQTAGFVGVNVRGQNASVFVFLIEHRIPAHHAGPIQRLVVGLRLFDIFDYVQHIVQVTGALFVVQQHTANTTWLVMTSALWKLAMLSRA